MRELARSGHVCFPPQHLQKKPCLCRFAFLCRIASDASWLDRRTDTAAYTWLRPGRANTLRQWGQRLLESSVRGTADRVLHKPNISWDVCRRQPVITSPRPAHHEHQLRCMLQPGNHRPAITPSRPARHEGRTLHTARHSATKTPAATASAAMHGANGPSSTHREHQLGCMLQTSSLRGVKTPAS